MLRNGVRRARLTSELAEQHRLALRDPPKLVVSCANGLGDEIDELVREHDLTSHDAACLAAAIEHDLPLATADTRLTAASRAAGARLFAS